MSMIDQQVSRRRTFAIIAHPDAGKTTLTEKLLLFGGAIQMAGAVKAKKEQRGARSDFMKIEQDRGISVSSAVMTFEFEKNIFNLLDTPGHEDFSEDTYRVLTAVDSAVMVIDGAKGIEAQTRKLFEVCRLRDVPITTFVNKLDRESRDPFELIDQIEQDLALDVSPVTWPIGSGRDFHGCYDVVNDQLLFMEKGGNVVKEAIPIKGLDDPKLDELIPDYLLEKLREEVEMVREICPPFDLQSYREGHLTPVFFGSAVNNFGVRELLRGIGDIAPTPRPQEAATRLVEAVEPKVAGFVFKVQANIDPNHRDRIAFIRLCSGHFKRGMKLKHVRAGKQMAVHNPMLFFANERDIAEEAWPGDIIGIPNHGTLRIGDTLTEGEDLRFRGVPAFAPELLQKVRLDDPLKGKHLQRALEQLAEEGASQVFKPMMGADWIVGVVGQLQFEVLKERIAAEYGIKVHFEETPAYAARWVMGDDPLEIKKFRDTNQSALFEDHDDTLVFIARNAWHLETTQRDWPNLKFESTREQNMVAA
ncbi:peptide chain release factor 3 [Thalassospira povalilytica]|uniref:peptide chain release factor 3 n=1 Tax=Thalassospira povalilytica TaxID=732237 RepID=UPI003AA88AC2